MAPTPTSLNNFTYATEEAIQWTQSNSNQFQLRWPTDSILTFNDLPGLVQLAVLWDSGFAISPGNVAVQMWMMDGHSMADLAVSRTEASNAGCTLVDCVQPNNVTASYVQGGTEDQMLSVSCCVVDTFVDSASTAFLGVMWSNGGDSDKTPHHRFDCETIRGLTQRRTFRTASTPFTQFPAPTTSRGTSVLQVASAVVAFGAFGLGWLCWRRRVERKDQQANNLHDGSTMYFNGDIPELALQPTDRSSHQTTQEMSLSSSHNNYKSAGTNKTLKILLGSKHLKGRRLPYKSLVFERVISKGASGEVWICDYSGLKSNNVLLTDKLEPKVIDFGVSRGLVDLIITAGVGTPYWTAPEMLEGKRYTEKADIYSFGVVLSELDTGRIPYFEATAKGGNTFKPFQILQGVMAGRLRPRFAEDCPARIQRLGSACLAHDPSSCPSARELVYELERGTREYAYSF